MLQLLKHNTKNEYRVWFRSGRIGQQPQYTLVNNSSLNVGIQMFEQKFYTLTKNRWSNLHRFKRDKSKYDLIRMQYDGDSQLQVTYVLSKAETELMDAITIDKIFVSGSFKSMKNPSR